MMRQENAKLSDHRDPHERRTSRIRKTAAGRPGSGFFMFQKGDAGAQSFMPTERLRRPPQRREVSAVVRPKTMPGELAMTIGQSRCCLKKPYVTQIVQLMNATSG